MSRWTSRLLAPVAVLACLPLSLAAQNVAAVPTYGTVNLSAGFTPDPQIRSVTAGGNDHTQLAGCNAYVHAAAPDLDLNYQAGSYALTINARSGMDVTLLVNAPDGSWSCDDDGGEGTDAAITFSAPMSGQYNIWVGTYRAQSGTLPEAQIFLTELGGTTSYDGSGGAGTLDWSAPPTYGTVQLSAGFSPDPYLRSISAGGSQPVPDFGAGCRGFAATAPDIDLNYSAGGYQLNIYAKSGSDVTLIVNAPDGSWWCSDDASGTNPHVNFQNPQSGNYNVWIGTYRSGTIPESVLYISEAAPRW
ncbi:MAG TPA: hypothetical protein VMN78_09360 [Longimicrobiales bacterium]|nr:hypothetical protein [Longimicrobiales bacterium]